jgi:amino acid transporter
MTAAQLSEYWGGPDPPQVYRTVIFYVVAPIIMLVINVCGVSTFGWIESIGGGLKISLVFTTTFALYVMAAKRKGCTSLYMSTC